MHLVRSGHVLKGTPEGAQGEFSENRFDVISRIGTLAL
jgi:hypothetical protein